MNYQELAQKLVSKATGKGAWQAEAFLQVGRDSSCRVRDGQVEDLTQATSKGVGLRVICDDRLGFAYSSDFEPGSLDAFVEKALELAKSAAPNPLNGLPARAQLGSGEPMDGLYDPLVASLPLDWKVKTALEIERAGKAVDAKIIAFDSVGAGEYISEVYLSSSEGLAAHHSGTYVYCYAAPVASDGRQLQTSQWMDYKRFLKELDSPEAIGKEAASRALRMLGARRVKSQKVPVVFDPLMAASFVGSLAAAANGDQVFKKSSVFAPLLGNRIGPNNVSVFDDGRLPRGLGTAPVDGEGVATRKTPIIENGILMNFLYDTFTARKANARPTGNASRSYRSLPAIGVNNLYLEPGSSSSEEIVSSVKNGLYVTSMLGRGANLVTGDYSRGANGLWIENGELAYPVQEITVAGNLLEMLEGIDAVGSDLTVRGSTGAPTLRFAELTVSGE
jgi:PmbA protein